ncbi:ribbon-helix-helix protein, CopG family [Brevibacterium luteolum]|uniref:type II toxin-antitoxin system VapB family antitoxin n=1 Tax=Brevibacterium luteolum TaxID=199591 RepID=UPI0021AF7A1C|nr:ribbon-helix-helix protein, CopG family [Brevibacterium luteolum]
MPNVLIRGLSDEAVARIDRSAEELGLSRNEFLRRQLEVEPARPAVTITDEHWKRSAEILADLADPDIMADAWR